MRRSTAWLLGSFAFLGFLKRRANEESGHAGPDPRADDLRRKLAESRSIVEEREEFEAAEVSVDETPDVDPGDAQVRRAAVHDAGHEIAARMRERH